MERIGIRELRQHASRHIARVAAGERIEVTDRGRPVAMLIPLSTDPWHDLVESARVSHPIADGDILDEPPGDYGINASDALIALRADER